MASVVDPEIAERIRGLQLKFTKEPQPELLIPIPNEDVEIGRSVTHHAPEFTSLCPLNPSQPDFANITITFAPQGIIVELKSLKFYLTSYRMVSIFHESVPALILKDLCGIMGPIDIDVVGQFNTRGGIRTDVHAWYRVGGATNVAELAELEEPELPEPTFED